MQQKILEARLKTDRGSSPRSVSPNETRSCSTAGTGSLEVRG